MFDALRMKESVPVPTFLSCFRQYIYVLARHYLHLPYAAFTHVGRHKQGSAIVPRQAGQRGLCLSSTVGLSSVPKGTLLKNGSAMLLWSSKSGSGMNMSTHVS